MIASAPPRRPSGFCALAVSEVERLTDDAVAITFDVPPELAERYRFTQGQHVTLRCVLDGVEVRRTYSLCAPASSGRLRVAVKRLEGGSFSLYANDCLAPGDVLDVAPPAGRFCVPLDPANAKHYAAIAAGSGITPILSILATTLDVEPDSRFTLVYGNRTSRSVLFLDELADLKDRYPQRLQLVHILSREPQDAPLLNGRIDAAKLRTLLSTLLVPETVDEWFLCGPFALVETARAVLGEAGVLPARVHAELFHVDGEPVRAQGGAGAVDTFTGSATVTLRLDGRTSTLELSPGQETVLDAALRVRSDAPYACKGGVCGTCRARLVSGTVRMDRTYALEQDDIDAGFVLACQSHPTSAAVSLDFDA